MRRSSSTSHIPKPKSDVKNRARSSVRTSIKDGPNSIKKTRPASIDRVAAIPGLKRSSSLNNFRSSNVLGTASKTSAVKKLSSGITTPTLGFPGIKRSNSNLTTPCSSRSRSKSPFKIGSERTNDKKWINEQYLKVRRFLQDNTNCNDHIPDIIRPPTINTFVYVMNLLLKEIDPRIEVNMANYKDLVLTTLKTLQYPGNISNSLLKTVNTMHAWPQVIAIFGWLIDLIYVIRRVNMPADPEMEQDPRSQKAECVIDYIFKRYFLYNNKADDENEEARATLDKEFVETFARILNIDEKEIEQLRSEVDKLSVLKEKQLKQLSEQYLKNDNLKAEIDVLQNEIDTFYESKELKRDDLDSEIQCLKTRREKLMELVKTKKENIDALSEAIKTQPCSVEEKRRMMKHIEEMKHTIDLKKEKIKHQKALKEECEDKLVEAKKKVETEVYRLNNALMKLIMVEPELRILHLKEIDFTSEEFAKDVEMLPKNIKMFENQFHNEITQHRAFLVKTKNEISSLEMQVQAAKEQVQKINTTENYLTTEIEKLNKEIENMNKKREEQKKENALKMKKIEESAPDVEDVRRRLKDITEMKIRKQSEFEDLMQKSMEFFETLRNVIMENLVDMNKIRTEVFIFLEECLKKIDATQNGIAADLHNLDELRE